LGGEFLKEQALVNAMAAEQSATKELWNKRGGNKRHGIWRGQAAKEFTLFPKTCQFEGHSSGGSEGEKKWVVFTEIFKSPKPMDKKKMTPGKFQC